MKNKFIIFSLIASVIGYSSTLPVNVEIGLSSGYSRVNISEKEFEEVGLKSVSNGGYNSSDINTSLSLNVKYPFKFDKFNIKIGGGVEAFLENNISKNPLNLKEDEKYTKFSLFKEEVDAIDKKIFGLNQKLEIANYEVAIYSNKYAIADDKIEKLKNSIATSERLIKRITETMAKYPTEESIKELEKKYDEAEKKVDKYMEERDAVDAQMKAVSKKLAGASFVLQMSETAFENIIAQLGEGTKKFFRDAYKEYNDLKKQFDVLSTKRAEASNEKINLFDDMKIMDNAPKKLEERKQKLKEDTALKASTETEKAELKEKKKAANRIVSDLESEKVELVESKKTKEENELAKYIKDAMFVNEYENRHTAIKVNDILNNNIIFGSNVYGLAEFEVKLPKDLTLFLDTKLGLRVSSNPLKVVTDKLEADGDKVDGNTYKSLKKVESVKFSPVVGVGIGLRYKGGTLEFSSGLNSALANVKLGYEF